MGTSSTSPAEAQACRAGCAACCIAPSISSPIPGMPHGKPAGVRCVQLTPDLRCALFGDPRRPRVCGSLAPTRAMCGETREEALAGLASLEAATQPDRVPPGPTTKPDEPGAAPDDGSGG